MCSCVVLKQMVPSALGCDSVSNFTVRMASEKDCQPHVHLYCSLNISGFICQVVLTLVFKRIGSKNLLGHWLDKIQEIPFILLNPAEIRLLKVPWCNSVWKPLSFRVQ